MSPLILFDNLRVSHFAGNLFHVCAGGRLSGCCNMINELTGSGSCNSDCVHNVCFR